MAAWMCIPFDCPSEGGNDVIIDLPFDANIDMTNKCYIPNESFVVLNDGTLPLTLKVDIGSREPGSFDTTTLFAYLEYTADSFGDMVYPLTQLRQCYLAKGFSAVRFRSNKACSGLLYILGKLAVCDDTIMAQVTFDYSSLIEVGTADAVAAKRKVSGL